MSVPAPRWDGRLIEQPCPGRILPPLVAEVAEEQHIDWHSVPVVQICNYPLSRRIYVAGDHGQLVRYVELIRRVRTETFRERHLELFLMLPGEDAEHL